MNCVDSSALPYSSNKYHDFLINFDFFKLLLLITTFEQQKKWFFRIGLVLLRK